MGEMDFYWNYEYDENEFSIPFSWSDRVDIWEDYETLCPVCKGYRSMTNKLTCEGENRLCKRCKGEGVVTWIDRIKNEKWEKIWLS